VFERFTTAQARRKYRLFLVDGHGSHLTEEFLEYCHRHKILLAVYPPHRTHTLQPLDVVMFKLLSTAYSKKLQQSTVEHQGLVPVKKSDFFSLSWDVWVTSFTEKNILNSFKTTGLSPLNPNVILDRFPNNSSDTSSEASFEASCYSGEDWRSLSGLNNEQPTTTAARHPPSPRPPACRSHCAAQPRYNPRARCYCTSFVLHHAPFGADLR
jgi:hypothetical protein